LETDLIQPARRERRDGRANATTMKLAVGRSYQSQTRVEEWMTADKAGNRGVEILSTAMLVQLVEAAAVTCLAPVLNPDDVTLGTHCEIAHFAPTPVGLIVRVEVEVVAIDGARIDFAVAAFDEREKVGEGTHERIIVSRASILEGVNEKLS